MPKLAPSNSVLSLDPEECRLKRMKRNVLTSTRLIHEDLQRDATKWRCAMITCTYNPQAEYSPRDVTGLVKNIRTYLAYRSIPFRYVWVLELTKRAKPHYHLILWLPWGMKLPKVDQVKWWTKGHTNMKFMRSPFYIAKYASKTAKNGLSRRVAWAFPKGARISGMGGLSSMAKIVRRWWLSPSWVRKTWPLSPDECDPRRADGGFINKFTGEYVRSPWQVVFLRSRVHLIPREPVFLAA